MTASQNLLVLFVGMLSCPTLWPHRLQPARLLCPWDFPGKSTGVGRHFLLEGIFPNQGLKIISIVSWIGFFTTVPPGSRWWINRNLLYYSLFFKVFKNIIKGVDTFRNSHFHIMCCFDQPVPLKYFKWICIKYKKYHLTYGKIRWSWILCSLLNHFK